MQQNVSQKLNFFTRFNSLYPLTKVDSIGFVQFLLAWCPIRQHNFLQPLSSDNWTYYNFFLLGGYSFFIIFAYSAYSSAKINEMVGFPYSYFMNK